MCLYVCVSDGNFRMVIEITQIELERAGIFETGWVGFCDNMPICLKGVKEIIKSVSYYERT